MTQALLALLVVAGPSPHGDATARACDLATLTYEDSVRLRGSPAMFRVRIVGGPKGEQDGYFAYECVGPDPFFLYSLFIPDGRCADKVMTVRATLRVSVFYGTGAMRY